MWSSVCACATRHLPRRRPRGRLFSLFTPHSSPIHVASLARPHMLPAAAALQNLPATEDPHTLLWDCWSFPQGPALPIEQVGRQGRLAAGAVRLWVGEVREQQPGDHSRTLLSSSKQNLQTSRPLALLGFSLPQIMLGRRALRYVSLGGQAAAELEPGRDGDVGWVHVWKALQAGDLVLENQVGGAWVTG